MFLKKKTVAYRLYFIIIWILIWQIVAQLVASKLALSGPLDTLLVIKELLLQPADTLREILPSFVRILTGFLLGAFFGFFVGMLAAKRDLLRAFLEPLVLALKSIPVASFVILALIWLGSEGLTVFVAAMVTFPMIYEHTISGINSIPVNMQEMALVYELSGPRKLVYYLIPHLRKELGAALKLSYSMSFKASVAAELIVVPMHSIGTRLYYAKIYFETGEVFAWTILLLLVCTLTQFLFGKLLVFGVDRITKKKPEDKREINA